MKTFFNKYIKRYAKEMIPVVLGILIALLINDWKQTKDDRAFANTILKNVSLELKENMEEFESIIVKHDLFMDSLYAHLDDELSIGELIGNSGGLQFVSIKNTSWKAFQNQNLKLIDFEIISALVNIDDGKEEMLIKLNKLMDFVYQNPNAYDQATKATFGFIMKDITYLEEDLLEEHKAFFDVYDKR